MNFNIQNSTIFLTLSGSHAYGTSTEDSDIDIRGVCIAPLDIRLSYIVNFDQCQSNLPKNFEQSIIESIPNYIKKPNKLDDITIYDIAKAVKLMANANPNMLELLFMDEDSHLLNSSKWQVFLDNRELFLSQKCKYTYSGYAHHQLTKIKSHRGWLLNPPKKEPSRKDFGLPEHNSALSSDEINNVESAIQKILDEWHVDNFLLEEENLNSLRTKMKDFWSSKLSCNKEELEFEMKTLAGETIGLDSNVLDILDKERKYKAARNQWNSYLKWKTERNPKRKKMEEKYQIDTKHALHLIRLLRQGLEIIRDGKVIVNRPDFQDLLDIKNGKRSFESIEQEAQDLESEIEIALKTTKLPKVPDHNKINKLLFNSITQQKKEL